MKYILILFLLTPFYSHAKNASGLFVEPGLTYQMGDVKVNYPSPLRASTGDLDGFGLMGRLGVHVSEVFFVAADARYGFLQLTDESNNYDAKAPTWNLSPVIGLQMPNFGLRVWGGYILAGESDPAASNGFDMKFKSASGPRIGAGIRLASISLNLEYQDLSYGKTQLEQLGPLSSLGQGDSIQMDGKSYVASVSFPVEI